MSDRKAVDADRKARMKYLLSQSSPNKPMKQSSYSGFNNLNDAKDNSTNLEEAPDKITLQNEDSLRVIDSVVNFERLCLMDLLAEIANTVNNGTEFLAKNLKLFCIITLSLPAYVVQKISNDFQYAFVFDPIIEDFDFSYLTISYYWSVLILEAKCWGEIFASTWLGYQMISLIFQSSPLFSILIYVLLPKLIKLIHRKISQNQLNNAERKLLILIFSFIIGAGTHYLLLNWDQPQFDPPPYFSPALVAVSVEFIGPYIINNRRLFVFLPVILATTVSFIYGYNTGILSISYFYLTVLAAFLSFTNLQTLVCSNSKNKSKDDMIDGLISIPINSMFNQLIMTILLGQYVRRQNPFTVIPDSIEEEYFALMH